MLVSVSMTHDKTSERHSRRDYTPMNVEPTLSQRNVRVINSPSFKDAFNEIFADAIEEYNERQTREDRKKSLDYWSDVEEARRTATGDNVAQTTYTYVLQLGDRNTLGVTDDTFDADEWTRLKADDPEAASAYVLAHLNHDKARERAKECLTAFVKTLPEQYRQFRFIEIVGHDDEPNGTFHFDVTFVAVGEGYKTGLSKRDSLTRALNMMGFKSRKGEGLAIEQWQDDVKRRLEEFMKTYDFERDFKDNHEKHRSLGTFQMERRLDQLAADIEVAEQEVAAAEQHVAEAYERMVDVSHQADEATAELEIARHQRRDASEAISKAQEEAETARREAEAARAAKAEAERQANAARASANTYAAETRRLADDDAEATKTRADERAAEIVSDAQRKALEVTRDAFVAVSEAKAKVDEREHAADIREQEARVARDAYKAAETAYKDATPTVAGISPGAFLKRCFAKLTELARPRKNPLANMVNLGDEPREDDPATLGDQQAFNALAFVQRFFAKIGKTIEEFGDEVARDIAREQGRTQVPDKYAVARAKQAEKDWFARTFGSKTEMGGTTHGRGDSQMSR